MEKKQRIRRFGSIAKTLVAKSREAAMAAVQAFNNPLITFKSEIFIVLMNIAWTYLLHAYFKQHGIEYREVKKQSAKKRFFEKTKNRAYRYLNLERCLNVKESPIDKDTKNNLLFLIGIRHEIEHHMAPEVDSSIDAKFQACCINYNDYVKKLFKEDLGLDKELALALQFSAISPEQASASKKADGLPSNINEFIENFEKGLSDKEFQDSRYSYRTLFVPKTANNKGQADRIVEYVREDSPLTDQMNKEYVHIKEIERPKHLPGEIVGFMHEEGFTKFSMHRHTRLWQKMEAKRSGKGFGVMVGKQWYWYDKWVDVVRQHCLENSSKY